MSIKIKTSKLETKNIDKINNDLKITLENKFSFGCPRYIYPHEIVNDFIKLPFAYAKRVLKLERPKRDSFPILNLEFKGDLRDNQKIVKKEAVRYLSKTGSVLICAYPGFGKTCLSINIAIFIKFRVLIVVNKIILMEQWKNSLKKFAEGVRVELLKPKSKFKDSDFYIVNAINVPKIDKKILKNIGTVIIDEAHLIVAETLSKCLQHVFPRYLIGLTATPYRPDGLDVLLDLYFGNNKIVRELHRKHTVYTVETNFKPKVEYSKTGRVNWGVVLDSQANSKLRNDLIIKIICKMFPKRTFLVLVKRISQGKYLYENLLNKGESVTALFGKNQTFDVKSRILIGTCSKVGVGFDHPNLNTLLLAADVEEYFVQYLGRVFRTRDVEPVIIDLIDKNKILSKHFSTRRNIYQKHGGILKTLEI